MAPTFQQAVKGSGLKIKVLVLMMSISNKVNSAEQLHQGKGFYDNL